jgi:phage I-like protein
VTQEKEAFLDRWSRLKKEQPAPPAEKPAPVEAKEEVAPPLPSVKDLKPDSDFTPFMNPKVNPVTRRDALKKLFADAHYNIPDPYEAYSEDYTKSDPIPEAMLKAINRVRDVAVKGQEQVLEEERLAEQARLEAGKPEPAQSEQEAPTQETKDVAGKQDA